MALDLPRRRPRARPALVPLSGSALADRAAGRAVDNLAAAIGVLERRDLYEPQVIDLDLSAGTITVGHNLGRRPSFVQVMPTVADPSFAWGLDGATEDTITITCVGTSQPGARIEVR